MSASFNRTIIMGNLVRDPELKVVGESQVVKLRIASNRYYRTKDGENKEETIFLDAEAWGYRAETINKFMKKGSSILLEGQLRQDNWENDEGQKRSRLFLSISDFSFVGSKDSNAGTSSGSSSEESAEELVAEDIPF